eukprot:jgi/Undpi1/5078/HiC_scaffold_19.g08430.m1
MSHKRALQQGAMACVFISYVGYVVFDRFAQHDDTALENAKRRGRLRGEAKVRRRAMEEEDAAARAGGRGVGGADGVGRKTEKEAPNR